LLTNAQTGELAQYSGGNRHLISPPVAAKMGITAAQLTTVSAANFSLIPQTQDYFPDGMFLRNARTGEISEFSSGNFHLVSVPVATKMGLTGNNVVTITADQYNKVAKGSDYFVEGMLIQNVQSGEVDIYSGGQRHGISVPVATRMNITTAQVTTISASQFNGISQGLDYFPQGAYLQNQVTGEISQYSGGYNHVVSTTVATVMGLKSSQLIPVSPSQYNAIPQSNAFYPEGIFVQNNQTGEIDQISGGQRHWVSPQAALEFGLTSSQIAPIGSDQFNAIPLSGNFVVPKPATVTQQS
jgi:hypothetical protein